MAKKKPLTKRTWAEVRRAEVQYARQLRKVARHVGNIIKQYPPGDPKALPRIQTALKHYAEALKPWAKVTAERMVKEIAARDEDLWSALSKEMARELRKEVRKAPTGLALKDYLQSQVTLITSLPLEAAERVHKLTLEGLIDETRASEIADEIMKSGQVSESRANLIARTEVARTASALTMVRAKHIGSEGYIWRTAQDADVRKSHKKMEGKFVRWDSPPTLSDGTVTHAGMIYNCRCYPEPVIPDDFT